MQFCLQGQQTKQFLGHDLRCLSADGLQHACHSNDFGRRHKCIKSREAEGLDHRLLFWKCDVVISISVSSWSSSITDLSLLIPTATSLNSFRILQASYKLQTLTKCQCLRLTRASMAMTASFADGTFWFNMFHLDATSCWSLWCLRPICCCVALMPLRCGGHFLKCLTQLRE